MKNFIKSIISKLYKNDISKESFINKYEEEQKIKISETYINDLINQAIRNESAIDIEEALVLIFSSHLNNYDFIK